VRILALTNLYPNPYQPHRAPFNRHQFRLLAERHPLQVIAPISWTDMWAARRAGHGPLPANRRVVLDGLVVDHPTYWFTPKVFRGRYGRFYLRSVRKAFSAAVAEFRPELVFAPWAYPDGWAAVQLARRSGLPVVIKVLGSDVRLLDAIPGRADKTAEALRSADGIVAVSRDLADRIVQLDVNPERIQVILDGIDRTTFHPGDRSAARTSLGLRPDVRHLLSVGNLVPVKGPDVLLDACGRLSNQVGPWELHVVGSGPMRDSLVRRAVRLGVSDRVRFHGSLPHGTLPAWYRAADAFVLASRSEGIPNVLLEAAACGCPYVATEVGGIPEVAHLGAGRTVPPDRPDLLADAIIEVLTRPPPVPTEGPRGVKETVAELAAFLESVASRFGADRETRGCPVTVPAARPA
jgi:glycosyltransferase involved in cell wall biosynthesis